MLKQYERATSFSVCECKGSAFD